MWSELHTLTSRAVVAGSLAARRKSLLSGASDSRKCADWRLWKLWRPWRRWSRGRSSCRRCGCGHRIGSHHRMWIQLNRDTIITPSLRRILLAMTTKQSTDVKATQESVS